MKKLLTLLSLLVVLVQVNTNAQGIICAEAQPYCTDSGVTFPAGVDQPAASVTEPGNDYNCLGTSPNPAWYYLQIADPGDINILQTNSNSVDVDFALWGPFPTLAAATDNCGTLGTTADCSYSASAVENIDIVDANTGDVYLLLITNYSNQPTEINAVQIGGTGSTDCDIVTCIPEIAAPQATTSVCNGGTIELFGLPNVEGASYLWTGPNGYISGAQNPVIANVTPAQSGQYSLIITTDCDSDPVAVNIDVFPSISSSVAVSICAGQTYFAGGADQSQSGSYVDVTIDANGCENVLTTNLTVNPAYSVNTTAAICQGESIFVGGALQTQAGSYTDVFTASTGCDSTVVTQLTVNPVPANVTLANAAICAGSSALLNATAAAGNVSYAWSNGQTSPTINATTAGTYTVTVSNNCGAKTAQAVVSVTAVPSISLGDAAQSFCSEDSNTLNATAAGATNYQWSTGSNSPAIAITSSGVYGVTVTGECGTTSDQVCAKVESCNPACQDITILHSYICNGANQTYEIYGGATGGAAPYTVSGSYDGNLSVDNELFISEQQAFDSPYTINLTDQTGCLRSVIVCQAICAVLPVELLRFTGEALEQGNRLVWTTANEVNNDHFTLYRSTDGEHFEKLTQVAGAGNSNTTKNYVFLDTDAPKGVTYYRLTQTDFDGTENAAGLVMLQRGKNTLGINYIQPVPVKDQAVVSFNVPTEQTVNMQLFNVVGQLLFNTQIAATEGTNNQTIDLSHLPAGVYAVTLSSNDTRSVKTLVKE